MLDETWESSISVGGNTDGVVDGSRDTGWRARRAETESRWVEMGSATKGSRTASWGRAIEKPLKTALELGVTGRLMEKVRRGAAEKRRCARARELTGVLCGRGVLRGPIDRSCVSKVSYQCTLWYERHHLPSRSRRA